MLTYVRNLAASSRSLPTVLFNYFFRPDDKLLATGNHVFIAACLAGGALTGSFVSVYFVSGIIYALFHLSRGNVNLSRDRMAVFAAMAFASYFFAELIAVIVHPGGKSTANLTSDVAFLGLLPLYSLMKADSNRLMLYLEKTAAVVSTIGALVAVVFFRGPTSRVELSAGNAGVLAVLAALLLLINMNALARNDRNSRLVALIGAVASAYLILVTGMRALWPAILLLPVLALWLQRAMAGLKADRKSIAVGMCLALLFGFMTYPILKNRYEKFVTDFHNADTTGQSNSIGDRLLLWRAGVSLIAENPWFGHGPGHVVEVMTQRTQELQPNAVPLGFSHFHNAAITILVRSGIFGLLAALSIFIVPLSLVYRATKGWHDRSPLVLLAGGQITYLLSGATGIMFGHDILDAVFITLNVFALYLASDWKSRSEPKL
jgi:O-antigen ligase